MKPLGQQHAPRAPPGARPPGPCPAHPSRRAQAACASAVGLAMPAAEVETYAHFWALRPWLDDDAAEAILDAALAAQWRREVAGAGAAPP
jgi:hypothetical protein